MSTQQRKPNGSAGPRAVDVESIASIAFSDVDSLLTVEDVAELLKLPVSWIYERTRRRGIGRIPGFRLGKYWRFRRAEVLEWLEQQRAGAKRGA